MTDTTQDPRDELLEIIESQRLVIVAQKARIAQMRDAILFVYDILPKLPVIENALATTDDLSALKAHDDALWNEALTTGIEWQATRGHTLDADDYENELRSLKR